MTDKLALKPNFVSFFGISLLIIIPPLLSSQLSTPLAVCDNPEQVAHRHSSIFKFEAPSVNRPLSY
jgi:hypothetical protein